MKKVKKRGGGRHAKQKGSRNERGLVNALIAAGIQAERTPLSGAVRSSRFGGGYDVRIPLFGRDLRTECKHYANGFQRLYRWLEPVDILVVRCDHGKPLVVMPLDFMLELAKGLDDVTPKKIAT